jgi:hypothetical protein
MRRLITYVNSLFLGVILGMIFVAIVHACPPQWQHRICVAGFSTSNEQGVALRK